MYRNWPYAERVTQSTLAISLVASHRAESYEEDVMERKLVG